MTRKLRLTQIPFRMPTVTLREQLLTDLAKKGRFILVRQDYSYARLIRSANCFVSMFAENVS